MNIPNPVQTPVGGAASGGSSMALITQVILPPVWPWWAHMPTYWTGAVTVVLVGAGAALGGWLKVVRSPGQKMTLQLTPGRLPTVQPEQPPAGG